MNLVKVKCVFCGKEFFRNKGRFNEAVKMGWKQYCSWRCLSNNKVKRGKLFCENCGRTLERTLNQISPHNYCSQSCATMINNKKQPKREAILRTCIECGKQYRKNTDNIKHCSLSCRRKIDKIHDSCRKMFGSWNNAVTAAGLQPNRSHSQRMYKRTNTVALDGHFCDSVSESIIDNWFTKNNIFHKRNIVYPTTNHKADWAIFKKRERIFIEYFGLVNDSPRYDRAIKEKKGLCRKYGLKLITILPQDLYPKKFLEENLKNKFGKFLIA